MSNCKGSIISISDYSAVNTYERRPCCICWNVEEGCITDELSNIYNIIRPPLPRFNEPYINPRNAMHEVGLYRQLKYDTRKDWIQNRINGLVKLMGLLLNDLKLKCGTCDYKEIYEIPRSSIEKFNKGIAAVDFADDYAFNTIVKRYYDVEQLIYDIYAMFLRKN